MHRFNEERTVPKQLLGFHFELIHLCIKHETWNNIGRLSFILKRNLGQQIIIPISQGIRMSSTIVRLRMEETIRLVNLYVADTMEILQQYPFCLPN